MKTKILINCLLVTSVSLLFFACQPEEAESFELENITNIAGVELVAHQKVAGGNEIELSMITPGIFGYWDYNTGTTIEPKVVFVYPILGTSTFTYHGSLGGEVFTKDIEVEINQFSTPINQDYYDLTGEDPSVGKTWVFDGTPGSGDTFWYMCPPNDISKWEEAWWNAGNDGIHDAFGKMSFNLNGANNYTYYSDAGASGVEASFNINIENQTISFIGANILGYDELRVPSDGIYHIVSLTEDEMILYAPNNAGGTGWVWIFKPE